MSQKLCLLITFVLVLGLIDTAQADPCDANLIGWWKFDEGVGTTVADSSAYNNNGVSVNPTPSWVGGCPIDPCNSGMDFDGVSDYVVCAERDGNNPGTYPAELMPDTFTISCWTRLDAFSYYGGFVSNGHEDAGVGFFLQGGGNGNNFGISMGTITGWQDVETGTDYETDLWYHVAATYDGQYAAVYVDGELAAGPMSVSTIKWQADNNDYPSNFVIGSWKDEGYTGAGLPVDGVIDEVRFYDYAMDVNDIKFLAGIIPGAAADPSPRYGARDASMYTDLSWTPGEDANSHDVYFGTSESDVTDANTVVTLGVYLGRQDANVVSNSKLVPALESEKTYYWRIDEVNETAGTLIKGRVWSFTVANYIVVEDFDSYADTDALRAVWKDYYFDPGSKNGAEVFIETDPDFVREGKSMGYRYKNVKTTGQYRGSWAEAATTDLQARTDWTVSGVKALVLYFLGDPCNGRDTTWVYQGVCQDQMYVELATGGTGAVVEYDGDMNDVKEAFWHEWNIELQDFNDGGVTLSNVDTVYIGFGGNTKTGQTAPGAGMNYGYADTVYFEDIVLWPPRCRSELVATDFTGDCITDLSDVWVMSDDWLASDANITATEPCDVNLIGWWKFDEGDGNKVEDSSAHNNNGTTVSATPIWVGGHPNDPCDSAMSFNGITDYLLCAERVGTGPGTYPAELMPDTFTISCWTKLDSFSYYGAFVSNGTDGEAGFYLGNTEGASTDEGTFGLSMMTASGWMDVWPTNTYVINTWYHVAASYDGQQYANFYVDGVLVEGPVDVGGPMDWVDDSGDYPAQFVIGSWEAPGWSEHIDGVIDDVRFYNYGLQKGEIAVLAGLQGSIYVPLDLPTNLVPRVPDPAVDPQYYPDNPDIINFLDYSIVARDWLKEALWP